MDANTLKGHLDLILLATLEKEPLYGLRIIQEVQSQTEGFFSFKEGTLYPALHRLEKAGWIDTESRPSPIGGPPRKYYRLTEAGKKALQDKRQEWQTFQQAMKAFGGNVYGTAKFAKNH